jgi:DNA-binding transcriptional ArsR family regulator
MEAKPQPRLARVASAIGEPARAAMLARLLDGRCHTAGELAVHAGIAASTASAHLKVLEQAQLVRIRPQGRHRYFTLADGNVAQALSSLLLVADNIAPEATRWERPAMRTLRMARSCYGHLAGEIGVRLHDALLGKQWIRPLEPGAHEYTLTHAGADALARWGVALPPSCRANAVAPARRQIYGCVDWSERREHLAGPLAVAILETALARGWLRRVPNSREVRLTPLGIRQFAPEIGWMISP